MSNMESIPVEIYDKNETTFDWISQHDTVAPLDEQSKRVDQIRVELNQLGLKVGSLQGDIGNLQGKLNSLESDIEHLKTNFSSLESVYENDISKIQERLARLENYNSDFDNRFQKWIDGIENTTVEIPQGVSDNMVYLAKNGQGMLISDSSKQAIYPKGNWINRNGEFYRDSKLLDITTYPVVGVINEAHYYADFVEDKVANFLHETGRESVLKTISYPRWQTQK
ncbi:putative capsid [Weevil wasp positive-strand RNA virus 1]|nr:putative capsid [Weevil wasp positive-strand RNA virus 1]